MYSAPASWASSRYFFANSKNFILFHLLILGSFALNFVHALRVTKRLNTEVISHEKTSMKILQETLSFLKKFMNFFLGSGSSIRIPRRY
jgi:hypothetical protein